MWLYPVRHNLTTADLNELSDYEIKRNRPTTKKIPFNFSCGQMLKWVASCVPKQVKDKIVWE